MSKDEKRPIRMPGRKPRRKAEYSMALDQPGILRTQKLCEVMPVDTLMIFIGLVMIFMLTSLEVWKMKPINSK